MNWLIPVLPLMLGAVLDAVFGDPYNMPHPIRLIGSLISVSEKLVRKHFRHLRLGGGVLTVVVLLLSAGIPAMILYVCYHLHIVLGVLAEGIFCYYLLAAKSLRDESMKVYAALCQHNTEAARKAVSMIVGRDTAVLDENGIIRAAVETVAENTSDGVTAPMLYMMLGGAAGGFLYKAANTMDSMLGYKNEKYAEIGYIPAKLDDVLNYIPSRLTALLMITAAAFCGMDSKNAYRIWKRDRRNHASPNSAQTEAVCAGALHIRLAGDAWYFGELHQKPYIGEDDRPVRNGDIRQANRLMYVTAVLMLVICCLLRGILLGGLT